MRIILKHIRNNLLEKKIRSFATVLFLVLLSVVIYIILSMPSIIREQYENTYREIYGEIDVAIFKENAALFQVDKVDFSDFEYESLLTIEKSTYLQSGSEQMSVYIVGASPQDAVKMNFIREKNVSDLKKNEVVISVKTAEKFRAFVGDTLSVVTSSGKLYSLRVAEIVPETGYFSMEQDSDFLFVTYETAESIFELNGKVSYAYLKVNTEGLSEIVEELTEQNPSFFVHQMIDEDTIAQSVNHILYLFILVFLILFTMLLYSLVTLNRSILRDRINAMVVFKSLGADRTSLSLILGIESVLYGIFGGFFGSIIGGILMKYIPNYFGDSVVEGEIQGRFQIKTALIVVGVSMVIQLVLSMGAIRTITKKSLLDMMKQKKGFLKSYLVQMLGGITLVLCGMIPYYFDSLSNSILFIFEMLCFLFGIGLMIPLAFYFLIWLLERILRCFSNCLLSLSALNIRTKSLIADHVRLITVNATLCILLITLSVSFVDYFDSFEDKVQADYIVSYISQSKSVYEIVNEFDGAKEFSLLFLNQAVMEHERQSTSIMICSNYEFEKQRDFFCGYEVHDDVSLDLKENEIILDEHIMKLYDVSVGDTIRLQLGSGAKKKHYEFYVIGTCDGAGITLSRLVGVVSQKAYETMFGDIPQFLLIRMADSGVSLGSLKEKLPDALAVVQTKEEFVHEQLKLPRTFVRIITAVLICGLLGGLLGLICNQINVLEEREKDLAIYYTTCMTKKKILQMIEIEEAMISIFVLVFSFAISAMLYQLLSKLLESMYLCFPLHFYIGKTLSVVCGVLVLLFVFMIGSTKIKLRKANYINIIKKDANM